jgi:hypothetical protein
VLLYFDAALRSETLKAVGRMVRPNGLFVCGFDWVKTRSARYTVYRKEADDLVPREFPFSVDNVLPIGLSWFAMHDDDEEMMRLCSLVGALRRDRPFMSAFAPAHDAVLSELGICPRGADGFLGDLDPALTQGEVDLGCTSCSGDAWEITRRGR